MKGYIVTLDLGTTHIKASLWCTRGSTRDLKSNPKFAIKSLAPELQILSHGGVEQSPFEYLEKSATLLRQLSYEVPCGQWEAISLSTQRGTLLLTDREGYPSRPLISWMDRRPRSNDDRSQHSLPHSLMSWITFQLTQKFIDNPQTMPPGSRDSYNPQGPITISKTNPTAESPFSFLPAGIPLVVAGGDKNCEYLGMQNTPLLSRPVLSFGTALSLGFLISNSTPKEIYSGFFITPSSIINHYHAETGIPTGGKALEWIRSLLKQTDTNSLRTSYDLLAQSPICFPYFQGNLTDTVSTGSLFGLGLDTSSTEIFDCAIEGLAFDLKRTLNDHGIGVPPEILLSGGASQVPFVPEILANALNTSIRTSKLKNSYATERGAARLALQAIHPNLSWADIFRNLPVELGNLTQPNPSQVSIHNLRFGRFAQIYSALENLNL